MKTLEKKKYYTTLDVIGYLGISGKTLKTICDENDIVKTIIHKKGKGRTSISYNKENLEKLMIVLGYVKTTYKGKVIWSFLKKMKKIKSK